MPATLTDISPKNRVRRKGKETVCGIHEPGWFLVCLFIASVLVRLDIMTLLDFDNDGAAALGFKDCGVSDVSLIGVRFSIKQLAVYEVSVWQFLSFANGHSSRC